MPEWASVCCSEFQFTHFISRGDGPVSFPTVEHMPAVTHKDTMAKAGGVLCCPAGTSELLTAVRAFWNGAVCRNKLFRRCG